MANDFISRDYAVENMATYPWDTEHDKNAAIHLVRELVPPADVVARDCFNRILAENDTMREQLASIGKKPGDSMEDVEIVKIGHWIEEDGVQICSVCGEEHEWIDYRASVCDCCGARMKVEDNA